MPGISSDLAIGWLDNLRNVPLVIPITVVQLHVGDPGSAMTSNVSTVTARMAATFAAPVQSGDDVILSTTGSAPQWDMTAAETITHISVWSAFTGGTPLWSAVLDRPRTIANGDTFRLGGGISLILKDVA